LIDDADFQAISSYFIKEHIICFDTFNISECGLTQLSIEVILNLLKGCVIKKLILSDNRISTRLVCETILREFNEILNFMKQTTRDFDELVEVMEDSEHRGVKQLARLIRAKLMKGAGINDTGLLLCL